MGTWRRAPGHRAGWRLRPRRGLWGPRAGGQGLTEQRQPAAAARQRRHGLRSPGSPGRAGPACDAAQSGAPRAAGGSLKDARHRPQIPSDWCKVEGGRIPLPTRRGRGRRAEVGQSRRSSAAEPTCPPCPQPVFRAPGAPRLWRRGLGIVSPGQ